MEQKSFFPEKARILSGSSLKLLALLSMLVDHLGICLRPLLLHPLLLVFGRVLTPYWLMRAFGRLAFPIFCFLLTEGFRHTRSRGRHALNLLIFALLSEIPFNLFNTGQLLFPHQNVFFTLLLGYLGLWAMEALSDSRGKQLLSLLLLFCASYFLKADYGWTGFCFILCLYLACEQPVVQALVGSALLPWPYCAGFAFVPINLYSGKRGFVQRPALKYAFYVFYPLHLLLLWLLHQQLFG
jgi:hypothetical protein